MALLAPLLFGACGGSDASSSQEDSGTLEVTDALVGESSAVAAAAYLTLHNGTAATQVVTGAECECAEQVSLHATELVDGVTMMVPLEDLSVEPGETLTMSPGGLHVMLEGLRSPVRAGDEVRLDLHTGTATLPVTARVVPLEELSELVERPR